MRKLIVIGSVAVLLVFCWAGGIVSALPEDNGPKIEAMKQFAEEQISLEAYGSAIEYYKGIIALEKTPEHYKRLAEVYRLAGKTEEEYNTLEGCVAGFPNDVESFDRLIDYYYASEAYGKCADCLERKAAANGWEEEQIPLYYQCKYRFEIKTQGYEEAYDRFNNSFLVKSTDGWCFLNDRYRRKNFPNLEDACPDFGGLIGMTVNGRANFADGEGMKYLDSTSVYDKTWSFVGGLALVEKDGVFGYVNSQFQLVLDGYLQAANFAGGVAAVQTRDGWMLIDTAGSQIGKDLYLDVKMDECRICSFAGRIFVKTGEGYVMLGTDGKRIGKNVFEDAKPFNRGRLAAVKQNGKWGYADTAGNLVIEPAYEDAQSFGEKLGAVCVDGKWGFISESGRMVIEPQFDGAGHINGGTAPVKQAGLWYYLQLTND